LQGLKGRCWRNFAPQQAVNPMSNPYRNLEAFEREVRKRNLIEAAIVTRYQQRGGIGLDERIAILDDVNKTSKICRHSELERLQKDANAMREKGERPIITVSETRLYITKSEQLCARREEEMAMSRSQIMTTLERVQPRTEEELKVALDMELNTITDETRKALAKMQEDMRKEAEREHELAKPMHLLLSQIPNLEHREIMIECIRLDDADKFRKYFLLQSEDWKKRWDEAIKKLNTAE
jgi:DNA-directed RNA polymerase subunit F